MIGRSIWADFTEEEVNKCFCAVFGLKDNKNKSGILVIILASFSCSFLLSFLGRLLLQDITVAALSPYVHHWCFH